MTTEGWREWRMMMLARTGVGIDYSLLWLNPTDNQGIRFMLPQVCAGARWEEHHGEG